MNALQRVASEMRDAERTGGDRAYHALCRAVNEGTEIALTNHELVQAISQAIWKRELATAQVGLSELEVRTALDAVPEYERQVA